MNDAASPADNPGPATWALVLAFSVVYVSWGTTYLAIKEGVREFPPALFGGTRILLAALILLGYLRLRGESLRLSRRELLVSIAGGAFLFVGGNGLITWGEKTVDSGVASVLVATTPLWLALLESIWPAGERLTLRGWLGVFVGLAGVLLLLTPKLQDPADFLRDIGPLLVLGSAAAWAVGTFILRYQPRSGSPIRTAGMQMLFGGVGLILIGVLAGEPSEITAANFTTPAVLSFFHLLIVGSLIGFVAYTWLLRHVSATLAGTYAYVNPVVALLVGWQLGHEAITGWIVGGMAVILSGVALVRGGSRPNPNTLPTAPPPSVCTNGQAGGKVLPVPCHLEPARR